MSLDTPKSTFKTRKKEKLIALRGEVDVGLKSLTDNSSSEKLPPYINAEKFAAVKKYLNKKNNHTKKHVKKGSFERAVPAPEPDQNKFDRESRPPACAQAPAPAHNGAKRACFAFWSAKEGGFN